MILSKENNKNCGVVLLTLIITACAGRLTPHASVDVQTRTFMKPSAKYFSTIFLKNKNIYIFKVKKVRYSNIHTNIFGSTTKRKTFYRVIIEHLMPVIFRSGPYQTDNKSLV